MQFSDNTETVKTAAYNVCHKNDILEPDFYFKCQTLYHTI